MAETVYKKDNCDDLQIRGFRVGRGGGHPDPEIRRAVSKIIFSALRTSFWSPGSANAKASIDITVPLNTKISWPLLLPYQNPEMT